MKTPIRFSSRLWSGVTDLFKNKHPSNTAYFNQAAINNLNPVHPLNLTFRCVAADGTVRQAAEISALQREGQLEILPELVVAPGELLQVVSSIENDASRAVHVTVSGWYES